MKAWKKGAIIGGIWPLLILPKFIEIGLSGGHGYGVEVPFNLKIVGSPVFISLYIAGALEKYNPTFLDQGFIIFLFIFTLPIFIGALIGSIIGFTIERYKQQGVE